MIVRTNRVISHLQDQGIDYEIIPHPLDYSAQRTAADTHTPGKAFAKPVILKIGADRYVMVVLPAPHKVDLAKAREQFGEEVALASEQELGQLFPDCELGAEPPMGNLYELAVYVSPELAEDETITFNAGNHQEAIRMRYQDFERLVRPEVLPIAWQR